MFHQIMEEKKVLLERKQEIFNTLEIMCFFITKFLKYFFKFLFLFIDLIKK